MNSEIKDAKINIMKIFSNGAINTSKDAAKLGALSCLLLPYFFFTKANDNAGIVKIPI